MIYKNYAPFQLKFRLINISIPPSGDLISTSRHFKLVPVIEIETNTL